MTEAVQPTAERAHDMLHFALLCTKLSCTICEAAPFTLQHSYH